MAEESDLERTEPASARKLQKAREEGNVPHSRELSTFAVLLAAGGSAVVLGSYLMGMFRHMMRSALSFGAADIATSGTPRCSWARWLPCCSQSPCR